MKYFYDTEFLEDGKTIELISIGIVAEDGREYYAVNADMPVDRIKNHDWLRENVWPKLPLIYGHATRPGSGHLDMNSTLIKPAWAIRNEVREFLFNGRERGPHPKHELWAYYGAYDHVLLAQMWGPMANLPYGIPQLTHDILTFSLSTGIDLLPTPPPDAHNALADARHVKAMYDHIQGKRKP